MAAVKSAREAADSAQNNTNNATYILHNVQEKTNDAVAKSSKGLFLFEFVKKNLIRFISQDWTMPMNGNSKPLKI